MILASRAASLASGYAVVELPSTSIPATLTSLLAEMESRGAEHEMSSVLDPPV